ncbi:MAG: hypothetical protein IJJ85_01895 [Clostridia bacterium]|nr:hypothetical protein [Clostridia bacterium]
MNDHISARYQNRRGKRLLCLLLCLLFLFSMDSGVAGVLVEPVQAAAAAIGAGVSRGVSGLGSLMGGSFSKLGGLLLSIGGGDGDGGDEEEPEESEPDPHDLNEVYWNPSPEDKLGPDGTVILLKGDDENSGVDDTHAVLTWERALSLVKPGGVIWVLTMETVLYSEEQPVTVRDGAVLNDNGEPQVTELKFYPGCSILLSSGIETDVEDAVGESLTLKNLKMTDKTEDEDPEDKNRLLLLNGGTVTLDVGTTMRGDVRIEQFSDETEGSESPEIYVTPEFADDFDANVDLTVNFDTRLSDHHANSGDKIAFDFLVFPEGFDVEDILDNVHLDPLLQEPRGEDNLVWSVRKKIGADNIVEIYLVEPYDGCVYVSGLGNDEWEGLYASRPVRTFARALEILQGNGGDLSYTGYFSDNVTTINEYRWLHGEFVPNEGLIRICGAPVEITETETWSMPHDTYWDRGPTGKKLDDNGNPYPRVDQSWVERYKHYVDDLIEVRTGGNLTLTDITVKGVKSIAKNATGSLLVVDAYGNATLGADALLTDNTAVEGGGARLVGNQAELIISGGRITNCLVSRNGNTGMGGGVYVHGGSLTMISGEITDNNANLGGGVYVDNYEGTAGSALLSSTGRIYLYGGSQITRNQAQQGGGVYTSGSDTVLLPNDASTATIAAYDNGFDAFSSICCISVTGNTASSFGGGWMAEDCTLTIDGAEVTGNNVILRNNSGAGGGIYLASSVGTISNLHLFNCNVDQSISSSNSYDDVYSSYSYNYYPNRQNGYRGRGGGAYFESCNVTMTDSVFEKKRQPDEGSHRRRAGCARRHAHRDERSVQ